VLWRGKPSAIAFLGRETAVLFGAAVWAAFDFAWLRGTFSAFAPGVIVFAWWGRRWAHYLRTDYAVTTRRVLFSENGGVREIEGSHIASLDVMARRRHSVLGFGTVRCFEANRSPSVPPVVHCLRSVSTPYAVYDKIQHIAPQAKGIFGAEGIWEEKDPGRVSKTFHR
jgi:hypothetical protein